MDERIREIAKKMGATIVAELPDVGHGALGAAHYAAFYSRRMEEIRAQESGELREGKVVQLKDGKSVRLLTVPITEQTARALADISKAFEKIGSKPREPILIAADCIEIMSGLILEEFHKAEAKLRQADTDLAEAKAAASEAEQALQAIKQGWQAAITRVLNSFKAAG
jgi:FtsZ-binding cell division protein ZapB